MVYSFLPDLIVKNCHIPESENCKIVLGQLNCYPTIPNMKVPNRNGIWISSIAINLSYNHFWKFEGVPASEAIALAGTPSNFMEELK